MYFIGINSFVTLSQVSQLSLVFFIILTCLLAAPKLKMPELYWVAAAFCFNLFYIILTILKDGNSPLYPLIDRTLDFSFDLTGVLELATFFSFYIASVTWFFKGVKKDKQTFAIGSVEIKSKHALMAALLFVTLILLGIILKYPVESGNIEFFIAGYNFLALVFVISLFIEKAKKFSVNNFFSIGFGAWAIIQWLPLFKYSVGEEVITVIGFSSSLLAKIAILLGIFLLTIEVARQSGRELIREIQEREQFEKSSLFFKNILAETFHEITIPLLDMGKSLDMLVKKIPRDTRIFYEPVESNYERVSAIINLSKNAYRSDGLQKEDYFPYDDLSNDKNPELEIVSVNTLLERAIRSIRNLALKGGFKNGKGIELEPSYGAKCFIECNISEIIQVFTNLIKNSIEAYDDETRKRVLIRSYVLREDDEHAASKKVAIEIEDHASGIDSDIIDKVWEPGFSTKVLDERNIVRGHGLFITKKIILSHTGADIQIESPVKRKSGTKEQGTRFTIIFPRAELLN